jgi:hypothetical protein
VLLVILAMLAALALIGIAFTTFSAQEQQSSTNYTRTFQTPRVDLNPTAVMNYGVGQLVADTDNPLSALRGHSLLVDMYGAGNVISVGPDGVPGTATGGMSANGDDDNNGIANDISELGWPGSDDRSGRIEAKNYYLGAFSGPGDRGLFQPIIGPGLDNAYGTADDVIHPGPDTTLGTSDDPFAVNFVYNGRLVNPTSGALSGGFNEDYDYPDRQNMFLALLRADGTVIVPSFHRPGIGALPDPDLTANANTPEGARARLKYLRPRGGANTEHPSFPAQASLSSMDVDNNADGILDSIWLDLGYPVQTTLDGRRFKPLFAFLVVDLDGKLNLNAHGNLANQSGTPASHADMDMSGVPLGSGYSVGEVALQNVFKDLASIPTVTAASGVGAAEYSQLLTGRAAGAGVPSDVVGRYGEPDLLATGAYTPGPGVTYRSTTAPANGTAPTIGDDNAPSVTAVAPYWQLNSRGNWNEGLRAVYGTDFNIDSTIVPAKNGRYGTPADFEGDGGLQVDASGIWVYGNSHASMGFGDVAAGWPASMIYTGESLRYENVDEQSEVNLYAPSAADAIFSTSDLEYLYRQHDLDASSLASRLFWLTPSFTLPVATTAPADMAAAIRRRMMVTTESWSLNRFSMFPLTQGGPGGIPDLSIETVTGIAGTGTPANGPLGYGLFNLKTDGAGGLMNLPAPQTPANAPGIVRTGMGIGLPVEIARGRRLDINRGYIGTITTTGTEYYRSEVQFSTTPGMADPRTVARDIFLLLRQLSPTTDPDRIKAYAQYAVNVVDFRDPDSIMTGFEYTIDLTVDGDGNGQPDGWSVNGDLELNPANELTNRGLVWGVEAPQLVINETFAYEDAANSGNPQLWFELFNPQHPDTIDNAFQVDLRGNSASQSAFQVVLSDRIVATSGEPATYTRRLEFDASPTHTHPPNNDAGGTAVGGTGATIIDPGQYYLVGPRVTAAGTFTPVPDFDVPEGAFAPTMSELNAELRLYLRRLADPTNNHDPGPNGIDGDDDDINPYLTIDALDVFVYPSATPPTHHSKERVDLYSVLTADHSDPIPPNPGHSLQARNENAAAQFTPLYFNNRPFANVMELLLVPGVRPQWLTSAFVVPSGYYRPYDPALTRTPAVIVTGEPGQPATPFLDPIVAPSSPFFLNGHLVNFLREVPGSAFPNPGLYRLLEFVEVPSRMDGYREPNFNPNVADTRTDRVPGLMNPNTALEEEQFLAMFNNHPIALAGFAGKPILRPSGPTILCPAPGNNPNIMTPHELAFPCQSTSSQPTSELFKRYLYSILGPDKIMGTADDRPVRPFNMGTAATRIGPTPIQPTTINDTMFREWPMAGLTGFTPEMPMFLDTRVVTPPGTSGASDLLGYSNFELQPLIKAGSVSTTHSNVFAVWVTVGFFEVINDNPARLAASTVPVAPPELGPEVNADIHQNIRHRGFFIIDRSKARGYAGPPRSSAELQDIFSEVLIHSRIIE